MNLYLDDDSIAPAFIAKLRKAGHDVLIPADFGLSGAPDPAHLMRAIVENRVLLSGNHDDFELLHLLIKAAGGSHPGIVIVRKDNDASRDMTTRGLISALSKLSSSGLDVRNDFVILNHWR